MENETVNVSTVKVARVGGKVDDYDATPEQSVKQLLEEAGFTDQNGKIYGVERDGTQRMVSSDEKAQNFSKLLVTTDVKGGC